MYCRQRSLHKAQDTNIDILQTYLYQNIDFTSYTNRNRSSHRTLF
jgi:hypothetical protein